MESATALLYTCMGTGGKCCLARRQLLDNWAWFITCDPGEEGALGDTAPPTLPVLRQSEDSILKGQSCP